MTKRRDAINAMQKLVPKLEEMWDELDRLRDLAVTDDDEDTADDVKCVRDTVRLAINDITGLKHRP